MTEEQELRLMQFTAISTACMQNTMASIKDRISHDNPYWTIAYDDVCRSIDREILWRETLKKIAPAKYEALLNALIARQDPLTLL